MDAQKILLANCYDLFTFFFAVIILIFFTLQTQKLIETCLSPPELVMLPEEQSIFPILCLQVFSYLCFLYIVTCLILFL